jgi:diguanylate cyclase (GGDEF)-like protein
MKLVHSAAGSEGPSPRPPGLALSGRLLPAVAAIGVAGLVAGTALLAGAIGALPAAVIGVGGSVAAGWYGQRWSTRPGGGRGASQAGLESQIKRQTSSMKRLAIYDPGTALYHRWYFELRLMEEIHRCERYGLSTAVLFFRLGKAPADLTFGLDTSGDNTHLAQITSHVVRSVDLLATVGEGEYAVCLPHTDAEGAEAAATRIGRQLREYDAVVGFAVYPTDASDAESLIEAARQTADLRPNEHVA